MSSKPARDVCRAAVNRKRNGSKQRAVPETRKAGDSAQLVLDQFRSRCRQRFHDPAFDASMAQLDALAEIAWQAYQAGRKSELTPADASANIDRCIGCYDPYATSHEARMRTKRFDRRLATRPVPC